MRRDPDFQAYGEAPDMSADGAGRGDQDADFVARLSAVFARDLFQPMFQRAPHAPDDIRRLIAEMRGKLDALDMVIAACGPSPLVAGALQPPPANDDAQGSAAEAESGDAFDEIGRNQRSRLRELTLLEALSRETRAYSLQQLLSALEGKGFADTSGAVVSQLHRLKKLGVINQPANGMYEITHEGLGHVRKLRASFGGLLGDGR